MSRTLTFVRDGHYLFRRTDDGMVEFEKGEQRAVLSAGEKRPEGTRIISHSHADELVEAGHLEWDDGRQVQQPSASVPEAGDIASSRKASRGRGA